jgi:predicted transcriptional regulator
LVYYKELRRIIFDYVNAQGMIQNIVVIFKNRYDELFKNFILFDCKLKDVVEKHIYLEEEFKKLNNQIEDFSNKIKVVISEENKIKEELNILSKEITKFKENQSINLENIKQRETISSTGKNKFIEINDVSNKLTETERLVLQILLTDKPKTAREIEAKIGKTREHTARLMKKLWQEGYVERETSKIPYVYKAADRLKKLGLQQV